jgi:salicylate hydroxylase
MTRTLKVAIIGGGIGGLAAALALRRRGIEVTIYEQSAQLTEIGAGITLSPNALKAFRLLGMEADAIAIGYQADSQVVRSWRSGRIITRQASKKSFAERFGASMLTIHRADLLAIFARSLPNQMVHLGAICTGVELSGAAAVAKFADGSEIEADVIVGADGLHSVVRGSLFGRAAPRFTGCVCWRGLVPVHLAPRSLNVTETTAWWGPHGHVVHYPVRRGELVNFVAHYDSDAWTEESWTRECDRSELTETYRGWNETLMQLFQSSERYYKWALYDRDPLERWGDGRVTLLGDSAHPMLPYLGQGAGMAVEDGCILAAVLAATPEDPSGALRYYERLRMPRTRRAQLGARQRAKENHLVSVWARLRRDLRLSLRSHFSSDSTPLQAAWLYDYDVAAEAKLNPPT